MLTYLVAIIPLISARKSMFDTCSGALVGSSGVRALHEVAKLLQGALRGVL